MLRMGFIKFVDLDVMHTQLVQIFGCPVFISSLILKSKRITLLQVDIGDFSRIILSFPSHVNNWFWGHNLVKL